MFELVPGLLQPALDVICRTPREQIISALHPRQDAETLFAIFKALEEFLLNASWLCEKVDRFTNNYWAARTVRHKIKMGLVADADSCRERLAILGRCLAALLSKLDATKSNIHGCATIASIAPRIVIAISEFVDEQTAHAVLQYFPEFIFESQYTSEELKLIYEAPLGEYVMRTLKLDSAAFINPMLQDARQALAATGCLHHSFGEYLCRTIKMEDLVAREVEDWPSTQSTPPPPSHAHPST